MCSDGPMQRERGSVLSRAGVLAIALGASTVLAAGSVASCAPDEDEDSAHVARVSIAEDGFLLDGESWWPTGFDAYQLATDWSVNAGCGAQTDLYAFFGSLPPRSLTRLNVFRAFAVDKHTGGLDFSPIDKVFAAAERHGQLLIPVMTAQDGACEDVQYKQRSWYENGWREPDPETGASFADWLETAVDRWSQSPAIAAWELIGEPEVGVCAEDSCALEERTCPEDSAEILRKWTDEAGAIVRRHDPDRLTTIGLLGGDQCGTAGEGFAEVAGSPEIDFVQYHDYDDTRFLSTRLAETTKPILVAELGIKAGSCLDLDVRARQVGEKIDEYYKLGAAGALIWNYVPDPRPEQCTYDVGPGDPLFELRQMTPGPL